MLCFHKIDHLPSKWRLDCDGASKGNPGHAGIGGVLTLLDDSPIEQRFRKNYSEYIGVTTCNVAEYRALIYGLHLAKALKANAIDIFMDSLLVVNQVKGIFSCKDALLRSLRNEAKALFSSFPIAHINHQLRGFNMAADFLATRATDFKVK